MGARYGSLNEDGISYTELEFNYAAEQGKQILAFVHNAPDDLPVKKTDSNAAAKEKLEVFRTKVTSARIVKFWSNLQDLTSSVIIALTHAFVDYPQIGWIRNDQKDTSKIRDELLEAKREIERLRALESKLKKQTKINIIDPLGLSSSWTFTGTKSHRQRVYSGKNVNFELSLIDFLKVVAIPLMTGKTLLQTKQEIDSYFGKVYDATYSYSINSRCVELALIQLLALDCVSMSEGLNMAGTSSFVWFRLTEAGKKVWLENSYQKALSSN